VADPHAWARNPQASSQKIKEEKGKGGEERGGRRGSVVKGGEKWGGHYRPTCWLTTLL